MITILAIDQSMTGSGVCVLEHMPHAGGGIGPSEITHIEVIRTSKVLDDFVLDTHARASFIGKRLVEIIEMTKPDFIVFETPSLASKGNATRTLPMLLGSLLAQMKDYLAKEDVKLLTVPPTSLKKFATGKGNCDKDAMVEAIREHDTEYYEGLIAIPKSKGRYDLADAYWLSQWVLHNELD
ncbi:ribonuclease H-like domain protein [Vibrio phage 1.238.A._10N.261.52.F10]|uniref:Ribonuclease H-like domain protein n=1 Tax=Vibrio phage 1.238.A._10N.261.52.F10 TaxID=1881231 RepID=A0A2I7RUE7_9CAUD|nr:RuvC-like Holliday junction resolvase [Vibrio phage 1.238.A._10N.261.52.F10]AUR97292.1 ribonuclease H-like domain protein [Vibrio phage 1.238.A._10N.261.52.F10]AUR97386.1 ribonuclease H-like domain protein [Vibrio phage 1.238.B._10N.261.52.F10]